MQSHDTYRLKLQQLTASLEAWSGFVADVARVETGGAGTGWRLALTPFAAGACPLEIVLDGTEARCDLRIGELTVEDWPLPSLDVVLPMVEAVVDGRVVNRKVMSAATALPLSSTTHILLADGGSIVLPAASTTETATSGAVEFRDEHHLPYRRTADRGRAIAGSP